MQTPFPQSYWVMPGRLLAGEYPRNIDDPSSRQKIGSLLSCGVKVFIDLTEEHEGLLPYASLLTGAMYRCFPIRDVSVPINKESTIVILDAIDSHLAQEELVYIHCWGGIGRTGLIVGCWLARHGSGGSEALNQLRTFWRQCSKSAYRTSPETAEQEQYILNWEAGW